MRRVVVIHSVTDATKTVEFIAARISSQVFAGVAVVDLFDIDNEPVGSAKFTNGMVVLEGAAIDQYTPLTKPNSDE